MFRNSEICWLNPYQSWKCCIPPTFINTNEPTSILIISDHIHILCSGHHPDEYSMSWYLNIDPHTVAILVISTCTRVHCLCFHFSRGWTSMYIDVKKCSRCFDFFLEWMTRNHGPGGTHGTLHQTLQLQRRCHHFPPRNRHDEFPGGNPTTMDGDRKFV